MSYDINIADEAFNITYNVGPMFYAAIPDTGIRTIYGMTGDEALTTLRWMREYFEINQRELTAMEPDNKWGTFDDTYKFLGKLILASINNKDKKWSGD